MSRTATSTITNTLIQGGRERDELKTANAILDDLREAGFTITPTIIENERIDVDIERPETVPWVSICNLCQSFKKDCAEHAGLIMFVSAVGKHFAEHHDIDLYQDSEKAKPR